MVATVSIIDAVGARMSRHTACAASRRAMRPPSDSVLPYPKAKPCLVGYHLPWNKLKLPELSRSIHCDSGRDRWILGTIHIPDAQRDRKRVAAHVVAGYIEIDLIEPDEAWSHAAPLNDDVRL